MLVDDIMLRRSGLHEPASTPAKLLVTLCSLSVLWAGCVGEITAEEPSAPIDNRAELAVDTAALRPQSALALAFGTKKVLASGIVSAENQLFSSTGRLYVSGDNGVFELTRAATGAIAAKSLVSVDGCKFGGMTERAGTLYAVCYDSTQSHLYAAAETATPSFTRIFTLEDITLANGMATDGTALYVTATGQGMIVRLQLDASNPLLVTGRNSVMDDTGGVLPNGIKIAAGTMYWGDFGTIRRTSLQSPNPLDVRISALTFFDDFVLNDEGVLVADYLFGAVRQFDLNGILLANTPSVFDSPSSVIEAKGRLGFGMRDLIVTEKGANDVALFHY